MKKAQDLGNAPVGGLLTALSVPAVIAMVVNGLYYLVDAAFVGWGVGSMALAGLANVFPVQMFMIAWGSMLGMGAAALISRRLGEEKADEASGAAGMALLLALVSGLVMTGISMLFRRPVLQAVGATKETMGMARDYLVGLEPGFVFVFLSMVGFNLLRAQGRAKEAGMGMLIGTVVNVILDPVFIFLLGTGVKGAAWATVLARVISTLYFSVLLVGKKNVLKGMFRSIAGRDAGGIFALGAGNFLGQVGLSVLAIVMNRSLRKYGTAADQAVYGILSRIHVFITMPLIGLAQGFQPIAGFNYGAGKVDRVRKMTGLSVSVSFALGAVMFFPVVFFPEALMGAFTGDTAVVDAGAGPLRITLLVLPLIGVQVIGFSFFQALGKPMKTLVLSLSRQLLFLIPLLAVLPVYWGNRGLWIAFPIADLISVALSAAWLLKAIRRMDRQSVPAVEAAA